MVEPGRSEGRGCGGGCGSGVGWVASSASYASANLSPLPAAAAAAKIAAPSYHQYPAPLAKYEDVVPNPKLFMDTLEKLHACMRTKFMIPIIGGKELDLHQLFVEVTSRGGIEKILREKKWKEVTAVFNFPSTATNASFVLRKYYYSLLQHYEQIYYFKAQGWTPLPAGSLQSPSVVPIAVHGLASMSTAPQCPQSAASSAAQQPSTLNPTECAPPAGPSNAAPSVGSPVVGVIDGKFESGYLVTVTIGTEKLKGVLYQAPSNPIPVNPDAFPSSKNIDNNSNSNPMAPPAGTQRRRRRRRKKSEIRKRDPAHPKPNRSGYNFFFAEQHARLKPHYPGKDREISRMIGELWTNLKDNDKSVYQEKALEDKERYRMEMERYRERLKASQVISDAVPLRQRLPDLDANMVEVDVKEEDTATRDSAETPEIDESESSMSEDEEQEADTVGAALGTGASDSNTEMSHIIGPEIKVDLGKTSQEPSVVGDVPVPGEGKQIMVPDCEKDEPIPPAAAMT